VLLRSLLYELFVADSLESLNLKIIWIVHFEVMPRQLCEWP